MSDALFGPLFGTTAVDAALDGRAWLGALCEVETALARASARAGLIELPAALAVGAAAEVVAHGDPGVMGGEAVAGGNPVIPLVGALRAAVHEQAGADAAAAVHRGATSQDILDTAAMVITSRALGVVTADLAECADRVADLAYVHRDTIMIGRTLLQQAVPTTLGALVSVWGAGLDRAVARLAAVRDELPVQLGGPAGTLTGFFPQGPLVRAALADELGLTDPHACWHSDRGVLAEIAGSLGLAAVAIGKVATDVVLLSQSEVGELREAAPGGSSSMPHKRNPIAAVTARAGAMQAPGLVATLLGAGAHELQRAAGGWHAEWPALTGLLRCVGGAASRLRSALTGLEVDVAALRAHVDSDTPDLGHAGDMVDEYLARRQA